MSVPIFVSFATFEGEKVFGRMVSCSLTIRVPEEFAQAAENS